MNINNQLGIIPLSIIDLATKSLSPCMRPMERLSFRISLNQIPHRFLSLKHRVESNIVSESFAKWLMSLSGNLNLLLFCINDNGLSYTVLTQGDEISWTNESYIGKAQGKPEIRLFYSHRFFAQKRVLRCANILAGVEVDKWDKNTRPITRTDPDGVHFCQLFNDFTI